MRLIKIFAHGFKSFADPITLTFDGGVTGIVGPNGSGKSNINDAVRWVLGENSSKQLRGDKMSDVIFAGSKTAPEMNRAEVTLTFDNRDRAIQNLGDTFTISRIIERGVGGNQYYVDGEIARQKDIKDIAMETGISKSSLAIISQGTVSDIAQASAIERRGIFEEAAGVSKYKSKKDEAQRKLKSSTEALEKVQAVTEEQEKQLKPLKKQAEKAKIYLEKSAELKEVEVGLLVNKIGKFSKEAETLSQELESVLSAKDDLNQRINESEDIINLKSQHKYQLESELRQLKVQNDNINSKLQNIEIAKAKQAAIRQHIISGQAEASREDLINTLKEEIVDKNTQFLEHKKLRENIIEQSSTLQHEARDIDKKRLEINNNIVQNDKNKFIISGRLMSLREQLKSQNHLSQGTKAIVNNKSMFSGFRGMVTDLVKFELQYNSAMAIILKASSQNLVVDTPEVAVKAINFLKESQNGRATFIPLSSIAPKFIRQEHLYILEGQKGYIGIASDLISVEPKYEILAKFLLGNILITQTIEDANKIAKLLDNKYTIVSLDGDVIRPGGIMQGGEKTFSNNFGIEQQISKLEETLPQIQEVERTLKNTLATLTIQYEDKMKVVDQYSYRIIDINNKIDVLERELTDLKVKFQSFAKEEIALADELDEGINSELLFEKQMNNKSLILAKEDQIEIVTRDLSVKSLEKLEYEKTLRNLESKFNDQIRRKDRVDLYLEESNKRLSEHYKMTYEVIKDQFELTMDYDEAEEIVSRLRKEITALGNVNIEALEQYEELEKRYQDLMAQHQELSDAKDKIEEAIKQMDKIIITRLSTVMKEVDHEINEVFSTMFGGGTARVKFTDPNDILESGVEIEAQPPGKNIKNLKLFSGGEKSLIAISLLFAILKAKPLPLCILDEVEAALDDANVVRYAEYLQKLKESTQFMVITHRHGTMSNVDRLIGATMQKRGITSFFTVALEDAKKIVEQA